MLGVLGGGGGGGGSGACGRLIIPAMFLPKTLYVFPGAAAAGVAAATIGNAGVVSFVASRPVAGSTSDYVLKIRNDCRSRGSSPCRGQFGRR